MVHLPALVPFPLLQVWVSLGQGGMVLLKLIFGKGLRRVGAVVGLWMQYSWCWGSWWSCTVCLQVGHWKSNSESIVRRTKGAGSMNLLGFTVTVWHTGKRDPHISKGKWLTTSTKYVWSSAFCLDWLIKYLFSNWAHILVLGVFYKLFWVKRFLSSKAL